MKNNKEKLLVIGTIILSLILITWVVGITTEGSAISKEEQVITSRSNISTEEERRVSLFNNLVDSVQDYKKYEESTLGKITEARTKANKGNVDDAIKSIDVVVENYPELKADKQYQKAMKEFSITENRLAEQRKDYNTAVKEYNRFVRKPIPRALLGIRGYEKEHFEVLDFHVDNSKAANLFDK